MMTQITTTDLNAAWSGEIKVRFRAGFTNTYYPRTVRSAMTMRDYYNKDRAVSAVRVDGPPLPRTPKKSEGQVVNENEQDLLPDEFTYELKKADADYARYLERRRITKEEHGREIGEWLDAQD